MSFRDLDAALFLDVDGVLLEVASTPGLVRIPGHLVELLYQLSDELDGALALVSGRPVDEIDRMFTPYRFATVGVHGCERRGRDGALRAARIDTATLNRMHDDCSNFVGDSADLLVEYKPFGVAIHYCMARERAGTVRKYLQDLALRAGPGFALVDGHHVCEIKPAAYSRGTAILELMSAPPFLGRLPIYIGDAIAQDAFETVNRAGGVSIEVGLFGQTAAKLRIADIAGVHRVLEVVLRDQRHRLH